MGGGNSVQNTVNDVINSSNNIVTDTMQNSSSKANLSQEITVDCVSFNQIKTDGLDSCVKTFVARPDTSTPAEIAAACTALYDSLKCGASNITMTGVLDALSNQAQLNTIATDISNDITSKIKSAVSQDNGILNFGNNSTASINSFKNILTKTLTTTLQTTADNTEGKQTLTVQGADVSFISMEVVVKNIVNTIQTNKDVIEAKNRMITDLQAETSQSSGDLSSSLLKIFAIIIAVLILIGVTIVVLKIIRSKKSKQIELVLSEPSAFRFWK